MTTYSHTPSLFTEREAADSMRPHAETQAGVVYDAIANSRAYGMTIDEIATHTGIRESSVCARRKALEEAGLIVNSGKTRKTTSGRSAVVWRCK